MTPGILRISGMISPGILRSTIIVSFGSGDSSGSSTIAWRMHRFALFSRVAVFDSMPRAFASVTVSSTTPRLRCFAISFSECPAGRISSKISFSLGFSFIAFRVSFTVRRSTSAARAIRMGGISIWFRYILLFFVFKPFSTKMRITFSRSRWLLKWLFIISHTLIHIHVLCV